MHPQPQVPNPSQLRTYARTAAAQAPSTDPVNQYIGDLMILQVLADSSAVNDQEREVLMRWIELSQPPGVPEARVITDANGDHWTFDPACKACGGTGRYVAGYSGREDDGNAPLWEDCDCFIPSGVTGTEDKHGN